MPAKLLRLISLQLGRGATFLGRAENVVFTTTQGVKQGYPLSRFLFVVVFDIPLRLLSRYRITVSAYVDDISSPAPKYSSQALASRVDQNLSLIAASWTPSRVNPSPCPSAHHLSRPCLSTGIRHTPCRPMDP